MCRAMAGGSSVGEILPLQEEPVPMGEAGGSCWVVWISPVGSVLTLLSLPQIFSSSVALASFILHLPAVPALGLHTSVLTQPGGGEMAGLGQAWRALLKLLWGDADESFSQHLWAQGYCQQTH